MEILGGSSCLSLNLLLQWHILRGGSLAWPKPWRHNYNVEGKTCNVPSQGPVWSGPASPFSSNQSDTWPRCPVGVVFTHLLVSLWWSTCKQHGHSYIFPSGRLDAVSTILLTLWIPWARIWDCPALLGPAVESFWLWVCGVVCVCVCVKCCLVCMWRLMVLRRLQQPTVCATRQNLLNSNGGRTILVPGYEHVAIRAPLKESSSNIWRILHWTLVEVRTVYKEKQEWSLLATCVTLYDVAANCLWQLAHL